MLDMFGVLDKFLIMRQSHNHPQENDLIKLRNVFSRFHFIFSLTPTELEAL